MRAEKTLRYASMLTTKSEESKVAWVAGAGLDIGKFFLEARYVEYPKPSYMNIAAGGSSRKVSLTKNHQWTLSAGFFF